MESAQSSSVTLTAAPPNDDVRPPPPPLPPTSNSMGGDTDVGSDDGADNIVEYLPEGGVEIEESHGDHQDMTDYFNSWRGDAYNADWDIQFVLKDGDPNGDIYGEEATRTWMAQMSNLDRTCRSRLLRFSDKSRDGIFVPLFTDDNGWEYQMDVPSEATSLPTRRCPAVVAEPGMEVAQIFKLISRAKAAEAIAPSEATGAPVDHPTFCLQIGTLVIRSNVRVWDPLAPSPLQRWTTEYTDYGVVVDVGHEDMPVWLMGPREALQGRLDCRYYHYGVNRHLPMFEGLLEQRVEGNDEEEESREELRVKWKRFPVSGPGYDVGCILPSLRSLGAVRPFGDEAGSAAFQEACDLLRRTRRIIDPVALVLPTEVDKKFEEEGTRWTESLGTIADGVIAGWAPDEGPVEIKKAIGASLG